MRRAIFTDLDGTFLDFTTYRPGPALVLARRLIAGGDLIVFCSSKTTAEQVALMREYGLQLPAIVENGCGMYLPPDCRLFAGAGQRSPNGGRIIALGSPASVIQIALDRVESETGFNLKRYSKLAPEELQQLTGLSTEAAERASQRDFSETLTAELTPDRLQRLRDALKPHKLQCVCGGRFHTVTSALADKGRALLILFEEIRQQYGGKWTSVAIGDSANDYSMLRTALRGYLVQQRDGNWEADPDPRWTLVDAAGPKGWCRALDDAVAA